MRKLRLCYTAPPQNTNTLRWLLSCPYEKLPLYYNLSDVVISIASSDGKPSPVLKAAACGTPLVTSDIESMKEWIQRGKNGHAVNPRDQMQLNSPVNAAESNKRLVTDQADHHSNMQRMESGKRG